MPSNLSRLATFPVEQARSTNFQNLGGKTMKHSTLVIVMMAVAALALSGCEKSHKKEAAKSSDHPATVEKTQEPGIARLTLTPKAVERLGIQTVEVKASGQRLEVPYAALLYDASGGEWIYTSPDTNVFKRAAVKVDVIQGDKMLLAQGPAAGTKVVSVGASELFGTEFEIGH